MATARAEYEITLKDLYSMVAKKMDDQTKKLEASINRTEKKGMQMGRTMQRVGGMIAAAFSVAAVANFARETEEAALRMGRLEQRFRAGFGSAQAANAELEYSSKVANQLGLDINSATDGYSKFAIAAKGTKLEGQGARDVFEGISVAAAGAGLSAEQVSGAVTALEQILSKGKVQAEELRGQLGERIPGAFRMAAEAMDMTTQELDKFMSDGKLMADEFLPRFAKVLKDNFQSAADAYQSSDIANRQRQLNEEFLLQAEIGEQLVPVMHAFRQAQLAVLTVINQGIQFYKDNEDGINAIATAIGVAITALMAYKAAVAIAVWWTGASTTAFYANYIATYGLSGAWTVLNAVMAANPIGLVITVVAALTAGIMYAWNKFEGFRKVVYGLWAAFKQVFMNIFNFFKRYFSPVLEAIKAVREGRWTDAAKAAGTALLRLNPLTGTAALGVEAFKQRDELTKGVADAYRKGAKEGSDSFKKDKGEATPFTSPIADPKLSDLSDGSPSASSASSAITSKSNIQAQAPKNIYINIDKFGEVTINSTTIRESASQVKRYVQEALTSAVNDVQLMR